MKKCFYVIITVLSLLSYVLPSQAQQAFYIYRNDGAINTFITTEIDSMTYSRIDIDSVAHDDYVVHEVYTPDSIYRIPLELIDSVGFVTPETVYQPGVRVIEGEMRNYIISRDGLTLMFQSATPNNLLPRIGDKLVTTEVDDIITNAFVGQVSEVNSKSDGIEVICEPVDLQEVFECYYGIIRKVDEPISARCRSIADGFYGTNGTRTFNPGKLTLDLINTHNVSITYNKDDELSYSIDNAHAALSLTPVIDYNAYLIVNRTYGVNVCVTAIGNYTVEEIFSLSGNVDLNFDFPFFKKAIPIPEALIDIEFEVGFFGEAQGKFSIDQIWTQRYKHVFHWEWSSNGHESLQKVHNFTNTSNTHTGKVALNGSMAVGGYGKVGVAFIATSSLDIAEIGLKYKGGVSLEGTYVPYKRDEDYAKKSTDLYNQIKDREIAVYGFRGLTFEANLFKWSVSKEIPNFLNIPFNNREPWGAIRSVPLFSDTKLTKDESGTYYASTKVSGDVQKTDVGFALINNKNEEDATYTYSIYDYKGPKAEAHASFFDKPSSNEYTVYPLVKYMGMELIAEPWDTTKDTMRIKEFKQISAESREYTSVDFKTIVHASLDSVLDVIEWGIYYMKTDNNDGGSSYRYYPSKNCSAIDDWIDINLNIHRDEFDVVNDDGFIAKKKIKIGVYKKLRDNTYLFSNSEEYELVYDQKPSLTFTSADFRLFHVDTMNGLREYYIYAEYIATGRFWAKTIEGSSLYIYDGKHPDFWGTIREYYDNAGNTFYESCDVTFRIVFVLSNGNRVPSTNAVHILVSSNGKTIQLIESGNVKEEVIENSQ